MTSAETAAALPSFLIAQKEDGAFIVVMMPRGARVVERARRLRDTGKYARVYCTTAYWSTGDGPSGFSE